MEGLVNNICGHCGMSSVPISHSWFLYMLIISMKCFIIGIAPIFFSHRSDKRHMSAVQSLAQARSEAREYGMERRREIRRRVREYQLEQEERDARHSCDHKAERN
jgi:hypothetical protein